MSESRERRKSGAFLLPAGTVSQWHKPLILLVFYPSHPHPRKIDS